MIEMFRIRREQCRRRLSPGLSPPIAIHFSGTSHGGGCSSWKGDANSVFVRALRQKNQRPTCASACSCGSFGYAEIPWRGRSISAGNRSRRGARSALLTSYTHQDPIYFSRTPHGGGCSSLKGNANSVCPVPCDKKTNARHARARDARTPRHRRQGDFGQETEGGTWRHGRRGSRVGAMREQQEEDVGPDKPWSDGTFEDRDLLTPGDCRLGPRVR